MLIQIYIKNEPLVQCDVLVARDDAVMSIPVSGLQSLQERQISVRLIKPGENMAMKAAVFVADAIKNAGAVSSPVFISCPDKAILDGICSMDYEGPAGGPIKCAVSGTKPQPAPRVRNKAKPKDAGQAVKDAAAAAAGAERAAAEKMAAAQPAGDAESPGSDEDMARLMQDPAFAKNGEVVLDETSGGPPAEPRDPVKENTPKIMSILKDTGIPSGQIPGVLEALREAMDAQITLPMQVKLKLAKDRATDGMAPEETAKRVAPKFDELKALLKEIDDANAAKK